MERTNFKDLLGELRKFHDPEKERQELESAWNEIPYEQRMIATRFVFDAVLEHAKEGGTYRYLIYDRLGFDMDAYSKLFSGLDISNEFVIAEAIDPSKLEEDFKKIIENIPVYLTEEDKKNFNTNPDRLIAWDFFLTYKSINEELSKYQDKLDNLKQEYKILAEKCNGETSNITS